MYEGLSKEEAMAKLLIIADDFTGALDTGVQLSKKGISTKVLVQSDVDWDQSHSDAEVLVVNTESRHLNAEQAYRKVFELCISAREKGIRYIYKKTDSTLRGNTGAELAALMDACNLDKLFFIPAYPEEGRITKGGYQYVDGVLLNETVFARDPLNPVDDAYIPNIISKQTDKSVYSIDASTINQKNCLYNKRGIFVVDAADEKDMIKISHLLTQQQGITGIAGCAGFAPYLSQVFDLNTNTNMQSKLSFHKPILLVCGSVNEISVSQVSYAEKTGIKSLVLDIEQLLSDLYLCSSDYKNQLEASIRNLNDQGIFIIKTVGGKGDIGTIIEEARKRPGQDLYSRITRSIGILVRDIMKRIQIGTLIIFGGDTALGIIKQLNCTAIRSLYELLSGIPISFVNSSVFNGPLITKAGGFGNEKTLVDIITYIEGSM